MPRRGENIYKRKDGRWEARYIKEITVDGKKKYGSVYADSYKAVKAKQQQCLLHPPRQSYNLNNLMLSTLTSEWLDCIKNQVKPNRYLKYENVFKNHICNEIGNILIKYILPQKQLMFSPLFKSNDPAELKWNICASIDDGLLPDKFKAAMDNGIIIEKFISESITNNVKTICFARLSYILLF